MAKKHPYHIICPSTETCPLYKEKAKYKDYYTKESRFFLKQEGVGGADGLSYCDVINYDNKSNKYICQVLHRLKAEDMGGRSLEGKVLITLPKDVECAIIVNLNKKS